MRPERYVPDLNSLATRRRGRRRTSPPIVGEAATYTRREAGAADERPEELSSGLVTRRSSCKTAPYLLLFNVTTAADAQIASGVAGRPFNSYMYI
jgi:hypothetical protein